MAFENKEVPSSSNSSYCDYDELDYDDDDNNESSIVSKLVLKYENLVSQAIAFKNVKRFQKFERKIF